MADGAFKLTYDSQRLAHLTSPRVLWSALIATITITALFPLASSIWSIVVIDGISDPHEARSVINSFSQQQRKIHTWITATLDVAYPLAYGTLFAGSAMAFFPRWGSMLALPALAAIPVDLAEGVVQILALTGLADLLTTKAYLTPLKFTLFGYGLLVTGWGYARWMLRRLALF